MEKLGKRLYDTEDDTGVNLEESKTRKLDSRQDEVSGTQETENANEQVEVEGPSQVQSPQVTDPTALPVEVSGSTLITHGSNPAPDATSIELIAPIPSSSVSPQPWKKRGPGEPPLKVTPGTTLHIFSQLFSAANLYNRLEMDHRKILAFISKPLGELMRRNLSEQAVFRYRLTEIQPTQTNLLIFYKPLVMIIDTNCSSNNQFFRSLQFPCFDQVRELTFGPEFESKQLITQLPQNLKVLSFQCKQTRAITYLPPTLTHLKYPSFYNQPPVNLPDTLTHLEISQHYNDKNGLPKMPPHLTHLYLGYKFNREIPDGILPDSLECLMCGSKFNQRIVSLPNKLVWLGLGDSFQQKLPALPPTLRILSFSNNKYTKSLENVPKSILTPLALFPGWDMCLKMLVIANKKYEIQMNERYKAIQQPSFSTGQLFFFKITFWVKSVFPLTQNKQDGSSCSQSCSSPSSSSSSTLL
eukprot:TRINITY_DN1566_c1_g1_i1.p1 TRINITY_DN1566_c1_g1~~TRINITY_DN1566_c1_g1_i1.p1  ORF type:complete len:469 (-),score=49.03 TRINITY_DN1566_c1_g1_i1:468-1874(-)